MNIDKILKITVIAAIILMAGSVFYYFVIYLPVHKNETASISKNQLAQDKIKYKDELDLATKLFDDFNKAKDFRQATDLRIYAPSFPGYKKEFIDLYAKWKTENPSDIFYVSEKSEEYATQNSDFKIYHDAINKQTSDIFSWESIITDGKINSSALAQLIQSEKLPDEYSGLSQYAQASLKFWTLENMYYQSEWGYRDLQLMDALTWTQKNKAASPYPDDIEDQEQSAVLQTQLLQNKLKPLFQ